MERCPFWSSGNSIFMCNKECPMDKIDGLCCFQILFNNDSIEHISELEELEYIIN